MTRSLPLDPLHLCLLALLLGGLQPALGQAELVPPPGQEPRRPPEQTVPAPLPGPKTRLTAATLADLEKRPHERWPDAA